jgi:hypothetical protein
MFTVCGQCQSLHAEGLTVCFSVLLPDAQGSGISGFRREVGKNWRRPWILDLEDVINMLFRNIGRELPSAGCVTAQKSAFVEISGIGYILRII